LPDSKREELSKCWALSFLHFWQKSKENASEGEIL